MSYQKWFKIRFKPTFQKSKISTNQNSSWADLKDIFRKSGNVTYTDAHYRMGQNKGEVCFEHEEDMKKALKDFDGFELNGRTLKVKKNVSSKFFDIEYFDYDARVRIKSFILLKNYLGKTNRVMLLYFW